MWERTEPFWAHLEDAGVHALGVLDEVDPEGESETYRFVTTYFLPTVWAREDAMLAMSMANELEVLLNFVVEMHFTPNF